MWASLEEGRGVVCGRVEAEVKIMTRGGGGDVEESHWCLLAMILTRVAMGVGSEVILEARCVRSSVA